METRRIAEALLRSRPTTFFSRPCQNRSAVLSPRAYSVSAVRRQQQPQPDASAAPKTPSDKKPSEDNAAPSTSESISSLLDMKFNNSTRTSRFQSPNAQNENRNTTAYGYPSGSSADDAAARYTGRRDSLGPNVNRMISASGGSMGFGFSFGSTPKQQQSLIEPPDPTTLPRLGPTVGRSVTVTDTFDLAKGLRQMDVIVARNRVRGDSNKQKYHERPGLKRKRLASERWRKRFMDGFKATVSRVQYLKRQGW